MFSLTLTHLRFTVEALTPVQLSGYNAGSQLHGAWPHHTVFTNLEAMMIGLWVMGGRPRG